MTSLTIREAQAQLPDLIHSLGPGDEVLLTENDRPIAHPCPGDNAIAAAAPTRHVAQYGPLYGSRFNAPLETNGVIGPTHYSHGIAKRNTLVNTAAYRPALGCSAWTMNWR